MKITKPLVKDNCKDCVSNCEHAGKDREFVCIGGVSCKKKSDAEHKKVYILFIASGRLTQIYKVYSDKDKAKEMRRKLENENGCFCDYYVREYEVQ